MNVLFPIASFAFIAVLATAPVYGQDNPFTVGSPNNPFGDYSGCQPNCQSNSTLQILSDTDWSGTYGESTGSTTVDGHGNKDINFSCSNTYSAVFQKKGQGQGFLTLNIVQPVSHIVNKPRAIMTNGVPIEPRGSVKVSKRITESDFIDFSINQVSNSSSSAVETNQPFNSTLREIITDPNGRIISSNDTDPQTVNFFPMSERGGPKSDIPGNYTFTVKNIGDSPVNVRIEYGLLPPLSPPTITTHKVTNSQTTTAQFGTVSVSGSC